MNEEKKWFASDDTELRPFDRVLARSFDTAKWVPRHFAYFGVCCTAESGVEEYYAMTSGETYRQCIPYAGNESLVDTVCTIPEPRQNAPQSDKPLEWGERVQVWMQDSDSKHEAVFCEYDSSANPYGALVKGEDVVSYWMFCERA